MAQFRNIVKEGDPILRQKAQEVRRFNDNLHTLLDDMIYTMHEANGCGLAAPQVGISKCVIVIDDGVNEPMELVNPVITERSGSQMGEEGCLSVPDVTGNVIRSKEITVHFQDRYGEHYELTASDFPAVILQHEIDHLDGRLFIDIMKEEIKG